MKCKNFNKLLPDYIDNNLSYGEKREMAEHIKNCKSCAEIYKQELLIDSEFSNFFCEKNIVNDNFTQNVLSQIDQSYYKGELNNIKFRIKRHSVVYAFAGALIVCVLALTLYMHTPSFKNFIASFINQQINAPKPADNNNTNENSENNTESQNSSFRILKSDSAESNNLYVYEPLTGRKIAELSPKIVSDNTNTIFSLLGDRVYFYNSGDKMIEYMTFDGKVTKLDFTKNNSSGGIGFIVSSDNKKIAWYNTSSSSDGKTIYTVYISDINGSNIKTLCTKSYIMSGMEFMKWSSNDNSIYLGKTFTGIGGKAVMEKLEDLYMISIDTGKEKQLISDGRTEYDNSEYISAMSDDDSLVAYFKNEQIFIKNMNTSEEQHYSIPINDYLCVGGVHFSPDGKYVIYEVAEDDVNNKDSYIINYVLLNLTTGQSKIIK